MKDWVPLWITWMIMTAENTVILACMAMVVPDPIVPFASFGIAFALALFFESPVVMFMTASNRLVRGPNSYASTLRFAIIVSLGCSVVVAIASIPAVGRVFTDDLLNLREDIALGVIEALPFMIAWPFAVGVRRFLQGCLIRAGKTHLVGYASIGRMTFAPIGVFVASYFGIEGGAIGTFALSASTAAECIAVIIMARPIIRRQFSTPGHPEDRRYSFREILQFYGPLTTTVLLTLSAATLISAFLAHGLLPIASLAAFPPVYAISLFFRSASMSQQEIYVMHLTDPGSRGQVHLFHKVSRAVMLVILLAFALSPASSWFFAEVSGLNRTEAELASLGFAIGCLYPWFALLFSWQRALLVTEKKTGPLLIATVIEFAVTIAALIVFVLLVPWPGLYGAMVALVAGHAAATVYLMRVQRS